MGKLYDAHDGQLHKSSVPYWLGPEVERRLHVEHRAEGECELATQAREPQTLTREFMKSAAPGQKGQVVRVTEQVLPQEYAAVVPYYEQKPPSPQCRNAVLQMAVNVERAHPAVLAWTNVFGETVEETSGGLRVVPTRGA